MRRVVILKTIVLTRKKAPKLAKKLAKNIALSSTLEVLFHHKVPDGGTIIDVTILESLDACFKLLTHL
jgi:hypothetical protein